MALFDEEAWERQLLDWRISSALCAVVFGSLPFWIDLTRWKLVAPKLSARLRPLDLLGKEVYPERLCTASPRHARHTDF